MNEIDKENVQEELIIEKYTTKSWFKSSFLGFFIGLAVVIPGISGSTFAILFKLYDKMIYAISNLFKKFALCSLFLLPIIIGLLVGIVLGFFTVKELLVFIPFALVCLFAGFMLGSSSGVTDEISKSKPTVLRVILLIIGLIFPIAISLLSTFFHAGGSLNYPSEIPVYEYFVSLALGFVISITQLVPGLSATAFLMSIGYFKKIINAISFTYIKSNPMILLIFLCLIIGFLIGLFLVSKFIALIFKKARTTTFYLITGFVFGSIIVMFINPEILDTYLLWSKNSPDAPNLVLNLSLGIPLFLVGIFSSFGIILYEKRQKQPKN